MEIDLLSVGKGGTIYRKYERNEGNILYVIGLVGPFGSGCSYVAEKIADIYGYEVLSLSDALKDEFKSEHSNKRKVDRKDLQDFGDKVRKEKGCDYLAKVICEKIKPDENKNYVVDSIRNPEEVNFLRKSLAQFFFVWGICRT